MDIVSFRNICINTMHKGDNDDDDDDNNNNNSNRVRSEKNIFPLRNSQQAYARFSVIQTVFPYLSIALYPIRLNETHVTGEVTILCTSCAANKWDLRLGYSLVIDLILCSLYKCRLLSTEWTHIKFSSSLTMVQNSLNT
jgi:hypothetical protein